MCTHLAAALLQDDYTVYECLLPDFKIHNVRLTIIVGFFSANAVFLLLCLQNTAR